MIGESFYKRIWNLGFWQKTLVSILIFIATGIPIYYLSVFLGSSYPLLLLFLPLMLTSGFYFIRWNLLTPSLAISTLTIISIFYYKQDFFDDLYITALNLGISFIFYFIVGVLVGHVNVSFKELRSEKEEETTARKKAEERKEFLDTLIRQDLRSKHQMINGYIQLLEEADLQDENNKYVRKAKEAGREAEEILELAKKLEKMEESGWMGKKSIVKVMGHVMDNISDLPEKDGVEIEENYPEEIGKVRGDYSLKILFLQILKDRIQTPECDRIKISAEEEDNRILLKVEDNGKQLLKDIKELFTGERYTGETSGAGGARYYMLGEIAEHNNAEIVVKDSELGGASVEVYLQKY